MLFVLNENDFQNVYQKNVNVTKDDLLKCAVKCYFKDDIDIKDLYFFICSFLNDEDCAYSISHLKYYPMHWLKIDNDGFKYWLNDCNCCLLVILESLIDNKYIVYVK